MRGAFGGEARAAGDVTVGEAEHLIFFGFAVARNLLPASSKTHSFIAFVTAARAPPGAQNRPQKNQPGNRTPRRPATPPS